MRLYKQRQGQKWEITCWLSRCMPGGQVEMGWGRDERKKDKKESDDCQEEVDKSENSLCFFNSPGTM